MSGGQQQGQARGAPMRNGCGPRLSSAEARADPNPRPRPWAVELEGRLHRLETTEDSHQDGEASGQEHPEPGHKL